MWKSRHGFSLVEVALAIGIVAFALLSLMALLPLGVKSNQISAEETKAAGILTMLEADLRNTHPLKNAGKSSLFGLDLPYRTDPDSGMHLTNTALVTGKLYSTGLDLSEQPVVISSSSRPRFQASVIYRLPAPGSMLPIEARLVVNWPAVSTSDPADLINREKVSGYVEAQVAFPQP